MSHLTQIFNTEKIQPLPSVEDLANRYSLTQQQQRFVEQTREDIKRILNGDDDRLLVIIGPCSIHDPQAGLDYAKRIAELQTRYRDQLLIVMRTYFEKPRTRTGWKGLMVDPNLDGSQDLFLGLHTARQFLTQVLALGVPTATEFLDTNLAPYLADLICWGAIGARTAESQPHRQLASALPFAVGIKNGTQGDINIAINAIHAMQEPQLLPLSSSIHGSVSVTTSGNPDGHLILRGGAQPNYQTEHVIQTARALTESELPSRLVIDFSHGNSQKCAKNQIVVARDIAQQLISGEQCIAGVMCESFLVAGSQAIEPGQLVYGQSVTDECLCWQDSVEVLDTLAQAVDQAGQVRYSTVA